MSNVIAADELRLLVERYERLTEEEQGIRDDKKDVLAEAKSRGYDVKAMRKLIRLRAMDPHKRDEEAAILATYCHALGMQIEFAF